MSSLLLSAFRSSKKSKDKDRLPDLRSPLNVPETRGVDKREASLQVEDPCRIFERYLVEMIVEEGKIKDLMDMEELLYCWKNLKCPVFIDLACRFYVEICMDLFSPASEEGCSIPTNDG
uniref:OVATE domain-containing protein n=1 Tax=Cajanus cajan TaxID=3821 RepID=A0A151U9W2_CAJCA|nr:hypothetical protein KK1_020320 [Cajanus cajan]